MTDYVTQKATKFFDFFLLSNLVAVREVGALMGVHSGRVLALGESLQRSGLGHSHGSRNDSGVGVAVRVVGAGLGVHSSWVLVSSGRVVDVVRLNGGVGLGLGNSDRGSDGSGVPLRSGGSNGNGSGCLVLPLAELVLNVSGSKGPDGSNGGSVPLRSRSPLRLGSRSGVPLGLGSRGGIPLRLRSGSSIPLGLRSGSGVQGGRDSGNGVGVPQRVVVDGQGGGRLGIVQTGVVADREARAQSRVHSSGELGGLLGRGSDDGHGDNGLRGKENEKDTLFTVITLFMSR